MTPFGPRLIEDLGALAELARELVEGADVRQLVLLSGPMGSGKTEFARAVCRACGVEEGEAASPTFAIHHRYPSPRVTIDHFDLFRLQSRSELESTGFWDVLETGGGDAERRIVLIEWPELLDANDFPVAWARLRVGIAFVEGRPGARTVTVA